MTRVPVDGTVIALGNVRSEPVSPVAQVKAESELRTGNWKGIVSGSKVSQMQWLEEFIRECLTRARSIETADQQPPSDVPEDGE